VRFLFLALALALAACASGVPVTAIDSEYGPHPAFHPPEVSDAGS